MFISSQIYRKPAIGFINTFYENPYKERVLNCRVNLKQSLAILL